MENISNIRFGPLLNDSPYVKPFRLHYTQNGKAKSWDMLKVRDSVSIILFNTSRHVLIFVKQFRPAVYYAIANETLTGCGPYQIDLNKFPPNIGITTELCSGNVDKNLPLIDIAREEIYEEVGYTVTSDRIEEIISYRAIGTSGAKQTLYYCEVTDSDKTEKGGGIEDELIEVVECTIDDAKKIFQPCSYHVAPSTFLLGILWFLTNKAHAY